MGKTKENQCLEGFPNGTAENSKQQNEGGWDKQEKEGRENKASVDTFCGYTEQIATLSLVHL